GVGWIGACVVLVRGAARLKRLDQIAPAADADCPRVSILVAARDEEEKLPRALATLLALDYPHYELIVVNDRSRDATPRILYEHAQRDSRLKVVHLTELPRGWLGKTHALQKASERAQSEWLLITDADVRYHPSVLRRSIGYVKQNQLDHLTIFADIELKGFWEKTVASYWILGFNLRFQPWRVSNPRTRQYMGVGAFQLICRPAFEAIGEYQRLALEVVDDVRLGYLVKRAGLRSGVLIGDDLLRVRWQEGLGNIVRGLTKNSFAALHYSVVETLGNVILLLGLSLLPLLAVALGGGTPQLLGGVGVAAMVFVHAYAAHQLRLSPLYGSTHPLGALLFSYILLRSMIVTLGRGGVVWRETFYSLEELRKGMV
ncbi:MAG: glycosyltransferase, partial [Candidatus Acidiferrales bacterium]